jgi:hypothetical protein
MNITFGKSSWIAFVLFYLVLILVLSILDRANNLISINYWLTQVGLLTTGVAIFALFAYFLPQLSPTSSVLLAFTVGVMTIIPALLMGLGDIPHFWSYYFSTAGGIATGSFLTFLFLVFSERFRQKTGQNDDGVEK